MTTTGWAPASAQKMTKWTNPLATLQRIVLSGEGELVAKSAVDEDGNLRRWTVPGDVVIEVAPGAEVETPSKYDRIIHLVTSCGHPACRSGVCRDPGTARPGSSVVGGLAPLLRMVDPPQQASVDGSLLPRAETARTVAAKPGEVGAALASGDDANDPTLERARARRGGRQ